MRYYITALCVFLILSGCSKPPPTLSAQTANRVVLVELFTYQLCPYCPNAARAIERLSYEYGDSLAVLEYHLRLPESPQFMDTLSPPEVMSRAATYGVTAVPVAFFDGIDNKVEGAQSEDECYNNYKSYIDVRRTIPSPMIIILEPSLSGGVGILDASVSTLDTLPQDSLCLFFIIYEDSVPPTVPLAYDSIYNFVVRAMIPDTFSVGPGDTYECRKYFVNKWNPNKIGAVAFVQNKDTQEVIQAVVKKRFL